MIGTIDQIAAAVGGRLFGPGDGPVAGASIDTRTIRPGEIFFAILGGRDGHDFAGRAVSGGAAAIVVSRMLDPAPASPWILVDDTLDALQALGSHCRSGSGARVVGLTGSCGKTTTKELIAAALGGAEPVLATRGNLNNHLGVPLTLVELGPDHAYAVVEMGANHGGEIEQLTRLADPDVGLVTCVAPAHTEFFGGIEGVARAKAELFSTMRSDAVAVVNLDDPCVRAMPRRPRRAVTYGSDAAARPDVLLAKVEDAGGVQRIRIRAGGETVEASLSLPGSHNALNATAAVAAASAAGVSPAAAAEGLASVQPVKGRGAIVKGRRLEVIDDTYNANPASVRAGLDLLCTLASGRRTVAVLGDMFELGGEAPALHGQVGERAAVAGVDVLVAVGAHAPDVRSGALEAGMLPGGVSTFEGTDAAVEEIGGLLREGDIVLVKGSRGMKMERDVASLLYW